MAVKLTDAPLGTDWVEGDALSPVRTGAVTFNTAVPVSEPTVAVTVSWPTTSPVATPEVGSTVAVVPPDASDYTTPEVSGAEEPSE